MPRPPSTCLKDSMEGNEPISSEAVTIPGAQSRTAPSHHFCSVPCCSSEVIATTLNVEDRGVAQPFFQADACHDEPINTPGAFGSLAPFLNLAEQQMKTGQTIDIDSIPVNREDLEFIASLRHWKASVELQLQAAERRAIEHQDMFDSINRKIDSFLISPAVADNLPLAPAFGGRLSSGQSKLLLQPLHEYTDPEAKEVKLSEKASVGFGNEGQKCSTLSAHSYAASKTAEAIRLDSQSSPGHSFEATGSVASAESIYSFHELKPEVLDKAEMYEAGESVWDLAFFIGLPYFGFGTSFVISLVYILNMLMQLWFVQIIHNYMLDGPIEPEFLDELLRFRVVVAHNADYADKLQMRSMASQICTADDKLHLSGRQYGMHADMTEFYDGAMPLCILTILCWIIKILGEASEATQFFRSIWSFRRGSKTKVLINFEAVEKSIRLSRTFREGLIDDMSAEKAAALLKIHVVVRVITLTYRRAVCASLLIALPRICIAIVLGIVGVQYLSITSKMEDLLLNGMALAFISDIDEIIYLFFVPRRAKTFMGNLEPLPVAFIGGKKYRKNCKMVWLTSFLKMLLVGAAMVFIVYLLTLPFFDGLLQATDLLCSGNTDFVVARSKATGFVHATQTQGGGGWTDADYAVLQLARPKFLNLSNWDVDQRIFDAIDSNITNAVIEPHALSLSAAGMSGSSFEFVAGLSSLSVADSAYLNCEDMTAGQSRESTVFKLQVLLGNSSIKGCEEDMEVIWPFCSKMEMIGLRAICPYVCGCTEVFQPYLGFFSTPSWGCPITCQSLKAATDGYEYDHGLKRPCGDTRPPIFFLTEPFSELGKGRHGYQTMFVWFSNYMNGMVDYLLQKPGFKTLVQNNARVAATVGLLPADKVEEIINHITTGKIAETILSGKWELYPGVPHVRGLQGCDFLTSPEFSFLLGIDLCDDSQFTSLRLVCPTSCKCGTMNGCPLECTRQEVVLPCTDMQDGHFQEATVATLQWFLNDSTLYHCPWEGPAHTRLASLCHFQNATLLRQICPLSCGCHVAGHGQTGFFGTAQFGCPRSCTYMQKSVALFMRDVYHGLSCSDVSSQTLLSPHNLEIGPAFLWWLQGFFEWYLASGNKVWEINANLGILASGKVGPPLVPMQTVSHYSQLVAHGDMVDVILSGSWEILPGVPHPRNLTGCDYMTSFEILLLYGIDFCAVGYFSSLRAFCPVSCDCYDGMAECPYGCAWQSSSGGNHSR